jgi:hypothetical protein
MAKAKKEKEKQLNLPQDAQPLDGCDFCMQFDYDEPHVVGASPDGDGGLEIVLKAYQDAGITFVCPNTGKKLRLFSRPLSDAGRKILEDQTPQEK